jgi:hypothetical protein
MNTSLNKAHYKQELLCIFMGEASNYCGWQIIFEKN